MDDEIVDSLENYKILKKKKNLCSGSIINQNGAQKNAKHTENNKIIIKNGIVFHKPNNKAHS